MCGRPRRLADLVVDQIEPVARLLSDRLRDPGDRGGKRVHRVENEGDSTRDQLPRQPGYPQRMAATLDP